MGGGGAGAWFTVCLRKRAGCMRGKRVLQGASIQGVATGGLKLLVCAEEKSFNRCSGLAAVSEVGRQFIVA